MDGVSQDNTNWAPVHCDNGSVCGYRAYVTLELGDHHVWHSDSCAKMSVLMYGFVYLNSYGQPAGILHGAQEQHKSSGLRVFCTKEYIPAIISAYIIIKSLRMH